MSRNYPDFISSYLDYAKDDFCPDLFHYWTAVSMVAAALERKCWLPFGKKYSIYPNLYIFLVAAPGVGKSVASGRGVNDFLRKLDKMTFITSKVSEANLITQVKKSHRKFICYDQDMFHCSAYFYGSEASNTLESADGDLKACITDWYDCNPTWEKGLEKYGDDTVIINNVCLNMLMGCTFNYLAKLIPEEDIESGFASRPLFIVDNDKSIRRPGWGTHVPDDNKREERIISDLKIIHELKGRFRASDEVKTEYVKWFPRQQILRRSISSEKMQSFLARKHVNVLKLSMVLAVSENNLLLIEKRHWDGAIALVENIEHNLPFIVNHAAARSRRTDSNLSVTIMAANMLKECEGRRMDYGELSAKIMQNGAEPVSITAAFNNMMKLGYAKRVDKKAGGKIISSDLVLLRDPDDELRPQVSEDDIIKAEEEAKRIEDTLSLANS